jgi:hypothetical protein
MHRHSRSWLLYPRGPRSGLGSIVPAHLRLLDLIRPTRRHIPISPLSGLYRMPSLCWCLGDPRAVPCFRCPFLLGMPSSTATGSPSAALTQSFTDDMGLRLEPNGTALPRLPIIRFRRAEGFRGFTGSLSLRPVELLVSLADLTRVPPSQRRLLLPSFPTGRSPFPRSDITTVATEQTPPMGLSPIGTSASIAAQAPSLHRSYPASSVQRASPPSQTARPVSRELPVDPYCNHRWDFPCCAWSPLPACRPQYPGRSHGICSLVRFHPLRPSHELGRVGSCIVGFGACSAFTHVTACMLAKSPSDSLHQRLQQSRCLHCHLGPTAREIS